MSVKPKKYTYETAVIEGETANMLGDICILAITNRLVCDNVKRVSIEITEIVEHNKTQMRKFFHGVIIPAFVLQINNAYKHPHNGIFDKTDIKAYLKAMFLGYLPENDIQASLSKALELAKPITSILDFMKKEELNQNFKQPVPIKSTEEATPEEYMNLINSCELLFFNLFNTTYDIRDKPKYVKNPVDINI